MVDVTTPRIHKLWPSLALGGAFVAAWIGERMYATTSGVRGAAAVLAALLVLAAVAVRAREHAAASADRKPVSQLLLVGAALVALGFAAYTSIPWLFQGDGDVAVRGRATAWGLALTAWATGAASTVALELAVMPVAFIDRYELRRAFRAYNRGLGVALLVVALGLVNLLAKRHEWKLDVTQGSKTEPTAGTQQLVASLTQPVRVVAFFPRTNEVGDVVRTYLQALPRSPSLELVEADQALEPKLAQETGTNENGFVVVSQGKTHEKIRLGDKLRNAKSSLKSFDQNFAKALVKVSRSQAIAYFTAGHKERPTESQADDDRPRAEFVKRLLQENQYEIKPLGVAEGLAADIPKDAGLVLMLGPEKPFLPEELAALRRGLDHGARILVALASESDDTSLEPFLTELGIKFDRAMLANDREFVRVTQTEADVAFLYTNRYSSHASVSTMTRNANKLASIFPRTGSIEKLPTAPANTKVDIVVNALDGTFRDLDTNFRFDPPAEVRQGYGLAAAITRTSSSGAEARVFVLSDVDVLTDKLFRFQGNPYLFADIVYWLRDVKDPVLSTQTEEDVRIVHKKDEDAVWFYASTLGMPVLVAGLGLVMTRGRKRR
jgi:hypothetical protein